MVSVKLLFFLRVCSSWYGVVWQERAFKWLAVSNRSKLMCVKPNAEDVLNDKIPHVARCCRDDFKELHHISTFL